MNKIASYNPSFFRHIRHFIIHLRWHYQVFILSGGYLLGGYFATDVDWMSFLSQFANVHLLLFGGATAYNSYYDHDKGPVGGLKHPPPMQHWMMPASLILQLAGLLLALLAGYSFALVYLVSIILFWLYSSPHFRWKGKPLLSLFAIGISTGTNSFLLGYLAAAHGVLDTMPLIVSVGVGLIILSLYPVSQLYQTEEDIKRGDQTFVVRFGAHGVIRFYETSFSGGLLITGGAIWLTNHGLGITFIAIGMLTGLWVRHQLTSLSEETENYSKVMRIKYATSLAFVSFIAGLLIFKYWF